MASRRFETHVSALWARLGLPAPRFGAEDRIVLLVEGIALDLAERRDGEAMVISGSPGRLSADGLQRSQQIRALLSASLRFVLGSRCGLQLTEAPTGPGTTSGYGGSRMGAGAGAISGESAGAGAQIAIMADWHYHEGGVDTLVQRIEDVLQRIEYHQPDLAGDLATDFALEAPSRGGPMRGPGGAVEEGPGAFIIRL